MSVDITLKGQAMNENLYALLGNPVNISKQPEIFPLLAKSLGQTINFEPKVVEPEFFPETLWEFLDGGGAGITVGAPLRREAIKLVDEFTPRAARAAAINCISLLPNGKLHGDMTTGYGFVSDFLVNLNRTFLGNRVLIIGAGVVARALIGPILRQNPRRLTLVNRNVEHAQRLVPKFEDLGDLIACGFNELEGSQFDIIINATTAGSQGERLPLPDGIIANNAVCYDMSYNEEAHLFLNWAKSQNEKNTLLSNGLGTLVESCAEAYYIWHEVKPLTVPVIEKIRARISSPNHIRTD
jgi:shikimate dehydrogenase